jgi:hypothetical protein
MKITRRELRKLISEAVGRTYSGVAGMAHKRVIGRFLRDLRYSRADMMKALRSFGQMKIPEGNDHIIDGANIAFEFISNLKDIEDVNSIINMLISEKERHVNNYKQDRRNATAKVVAEHIEALIEEIKAVS